MTEEEYNNKLIELGVVAEEYTAYLSTRIRFKHPILGVIGKIGYSKSAVEDLETMHHIDASSATRRAVIEMLEKEIDLVAVNMIEKDSAKIFDTFTFDYIESLVDRHPNIGKIMADPKWGK